MQLSEVITAVTTQGGFDSSATGTSDATIRDWINESVQEALARSKYRRAQIELGPTVADQADYAIPANVVEVRALRVDGSRAWKRLEQLEDLWELEQSGSASAVLGTPGAFVAHFAEDGDADADEDTLPTVKLWPTPTTAGLTIEAIAATTLPADIDASTLTTYTIPLPADVVRPIAVDGAIRLGKLRVNEREDLAAPFQGRYDAAVLALTKRKKSRIGGGPGQARLVRPSMV